MQIKKTRLALITIVAVLLIAAVSFSGCLGDSERDCHDSGSEDCYDNGYNDNGYNGPDETGRIPYEPYIPHHNYQNRPLCPGC